MVDSKKSNEEMLLKAIQHYQDGLARYMERNDEFKMLHSLNKLSSYPIRLRHLQETGVGRTVNSLVKVEGKVGELAKSLISKWKQMVEEEKEAQSQNSSSQSEESPESHSHSHYDDKSEQYSKCERSRSSSERNNSSDEEQRKSVKLEAEKENHRAERHKRSKERHDSRDNKKHKSSHSEKHKQSDKHRSKSDHEHSSRHKTEHSSRSDKNEEDRGSSKKKDGKGDRKERKENSEHRDKDNRSHKDKDKSSRRDEDESLKKEKNRKREHENNDKNHKEKEDKSKQCETKEKDKRSSSSSKEKLSSSKHYKTEISSESGTSFAEALGMMEMPKKEKKVEKKESTSSSRHNKDKSSSKSGDKQAKTEAPKENKSEKKEKSPKHKKSELSSESGTSFANALGMLDIPKKEKKPEKKEKTSSSWQSRGEISSESGTSFADALGMVAFPKQDKKSSKRKRNEGEERTDDREDLEIGSNSGTSFEDALGMISAPKKQKKSTDKPAVRSASPLENGSPPSLPLPSEPLDKVDLLSSLLPSITPNYRPIRITETHSFNELDSLNTMMKHKHQRTKIYSGNKSLYTKVPSLFDICVQLLQVHIDAIEGTGGVPYSILKPVLEKATPEQLYRLEYYNSYLTEDSDELWKLHCQKSFRNKEREELESWRDMYTRCIEERNAKLEIVTANIKQSRQMSAPVRTTKIAYIDPPSSLSRRSVKHSAAPMAKAKVVNMIKDSRASADVVVTHQRRASRVAPSPGPSSQAKVVKKMAPLMAKSLSAFKNRRYK